MSVLSRNLFSCAFSSYSQRSFTRILTPSNSRLYVRRFVSNQDDTSNFNYRPLITNIKTPNFRKEEKIIRSPKSPHDVGVQKKKREMEETIIEKCMVSSNNYKKALKFVFRLEISMVPLRKLWEHPKKCLFWRYISGSSFHFNSQLAKCIPHTNQRVWEIPLRYFKWKFPDSHSD